MSAPNPKLQVIANGSNATKAGLKRELAEYLAHNANPAITATIDHVTGTRITITASSPADIAQLVQATLTTSNPVDLV